MEASVAPWPSVRSALWQLIDYAGLFPPAKLAMPDAWAEYRAARAGTFSWMLGRFIVPASLLLGLSEKPRGPFSVIADVDDLSRIATLRATIEALEVPPAGDAIRTVATFAADAAAAGLAGLPAFFEIPRKGWPNELATAMEALARARCGAKLRCGGLNVQAFPSVQEVVEFIAAAAAASVPYKATGGLHHPVRHVDAATGFYMHGFLNLLAASALAPRAEPALLEAIVGEEDAAAFRFDESALWWRDRRIERRELSRARESAFVAYGSCSFAEPVEDLRALGVLGAT